MIGGTVVVEDPSEPEHRVLMGAGCRAQEHRLTVDELDELDVEREELLQRHRFPNDDGLTHDHDVSWHVAIPFLLNAIRPRRDGGGAA